MDDEPRSLWQTALRQLAQSVSPANYETWLSGTEGVRWQGDTLIVGTRSEFATEWLLKRLRPEIIRVLTNLAGRPADVAFEPLRADEAEALALGTASAAATAPSRPRLRDRYTFESFVVGPQNRLAAAAALGTADAPGTLYNPLFLYGAAGLGKTHLLHAIEHRTLDRGLSVIYTSAEQFTNQLVTSIQHRTQEQFRERFRSVEVLLVDDIQFIAGKEQTQLEFFHTFNDLYEAGRQIVISSDKSPALITQLEERLRTRFGGGMVGDIQPPDIETRVAILRSKVAEQRVRIPDDVLYVIASRVTSNIRELEGSLTRVLAYARMIDEELTPAVVQSALASLEPPEPLLPPTPAQIIEVICRYFDLTQDALLSKSREKRVAYPRQLAMYLMRELAHRSLVEIGAALGGRDHSTVHHGWRRMERSLAIDPETKRDIGTLREMIEQSRRSA